MDFGHVTLKNADVSTIKYADSIFLLLFDRLHSGLCLGMARASTVEIEEMVMGAF